MQKMNLNPKTLSRQFIAVIKVLALLLGTPAFAQTLQYSAPYDMGPENAFVISAHILEDAFLTIDDDLGNILRYPAENSETTGLFLLGIGALMLADVPLTNFYQDSVEPIFGDFELPPLNLGSSFNVFSNESRYLYAGIAGTYALGLIANDEKSQAAAVLATKAVAYSYLTSHVLLKSGIGRNRPVQNLSTLEGDPGVFTTDPFDIGNFHGVALKSTPFGTAMPSFHVTQYFAVARVYSGMYDNYLVPYGLAGVLFASNIRGHRHWVSDMVAGALIGTAIGEVVLDGYYDSQTAAISITPHVSADEIGVYFSKSF